MKHLITIEVEVSDETFKDRSEELYSDEPNITQEQYIRYEIEWWTQSSFDKIEIKEAYTIPTDEWQVIVDYEKKFYDVLLDDGTVIPYCWPNAWVYNSTTESGVSYQAYICEHVKARLSANQMPGFPTEPSESDELNILSSLGK